MAAWDGDNEVSRERERKSKHQERGDGGLGEEQSKQGES